MKSFIEKHYLCNYGKNDALNRVNKRAIDVDELLKDAKREYREGRYIEEVLK